MPTIYIDIETIALPLPERERFRPHRDDVPLGNLKDPAKIEAKIAEAMKAFDDGTDSALDPMQGRIALIGLAVDDGPVQHIYDEDEGDLLLSFWMAVHNVDNCKHDESTHRARLVGHNIRFDAGFLVRRSWINDAAPPRWLVDDLFTFQPHYWLDTMTRWQLGDRKADWVKLKALAATFGVTVKDSEVNGEQFGMWWKKDREKCLEYNRQDVEAVREVWKFIGGL